MPPAARARSLRQARRRAPGARERAPPHHGRSSRPVTGAWTAAVRLGRAATWSMCCCASALCLRQMHGEAVLAGALGPGCLPQCVHPGDHGAQGWRSSGHQQRWGGVACIYRGADLFDALQHCAGCWTLGMQLRTLIA